MENWLYKSFSKSIPEVEWRIEGEKFHVNNNDGHSLFINKKEGGISESSENFSLKGLQEFNILYCNDVFIKNFPIAYLESFNLEYLVSLSDIYNGNNHRDRWLELVEIYLVCSKYSFDQKYLDKVFSLTKFSTLEERFDKLYFCNYSRYFELVLHLKKITNQPKETIVNNLSLFFFPNDTEVPLGFNTIHFYKEKK